MKRETKARIKSAALALMMVAASVPFSEFSPVVVAQAAVAAPRIYFDGNAGKDSAYVITGSFIDVGESYASGTYVPSGLSVANDKGIVIDPTTPGSGVTFEPAQKPNVNTINFPSDFNPNGATVADMSGQDPRDIAEKVFNIRGHYYTLVPDGKVTERVTKNGQTVALGSDVKTDTEEAIMTYSRMTLKCDVEELLGDKPHFVIDPDADAPVGVFDVFADPDDQPTITVRECTQNGDIKGNVTKRLVINVYNSQRDITFTLNPQNTTRNVTTDPVTGAETVTVDNFIKLNTTFELIYTMPESNALYLTVMTPQAAMVKMEQQIANSTGEGSDQSYIQLSNNETLDYIDTDFNLRYLIKPFGDNYRFRVDWKWEPTAIRGDDGNFRDLTPQEKTNAQALLSPPNFQNNNGNNDWQSAGLPNDENRRMVDDVRGILTATVYYNTDSSNYLETSTNKTKGTDGTWKVDPTKKLPQKEIIIKGTGVKPTATGVLKRTGDRYSATPIEEKIKEVIAAGTPGGSAASDSNTKIISMDAYRGNIPEYNQKLEDPYMYQLELGMGMKNAASPNALVEVTGDVDAVSFEIDEGDGLGYKAVPAGTASFEIKNNKYDPKGTNIDQGFGGLRINAEKFPPDTDAMGPVYITISYFKKGVNGSLEPNRNAIFYIRVLPKDNTPGQDNRLKNLTIRTEDDEVMGADQGFVFDKDTRAYNITIPFRASSIRLYPEIYDPDAAGHDIQINMKDAMNNDVTIHTAPRPGEFKDSGIYNGIYYTIPNNDWSFYIPFYAEGADPNKDRSMIGKAYTITMVTPCHDPRSEFWQPPYTLKVTRAAPSKINTLSSLGIWLEDAEPTEANNLVKNFTPENIASKDTYEIWIPYSTKELRIRTEKTDPASSDVEFKVRHLDDYKLEGITSSDQNKEWLKEVKEHFKLLPATSGGDMYLEFTVTSEEGVVMESGGKRTYTVRVRREDPKDDAFMSGFEVTNNDEETLDYTPSFSPDTKIYTLEIPYSVKQIKFNITTNDPNVSEVELWQTKVASGDDNKLLWLTSNDAATALKLGVLTKGIDVQDMTTDYVKNNNGYHPFYIRIVPESEKAQYVQEYLLRVRRAEPSTDAKLKTLLLKDQENADIKTFGFHPDETEYHITVPYKTTGVSFTPTTNHEYAKVELSYDLLTDLFPYEVQSGATSKVINLNDKPEVEKEFKVKVTAEDGKTVITYHVFIAREKPSDDARLKALKTENTSNFKPLFISSKTDYTADVNEGAPGVIITPTANHPGATIKVDGVVVQSGSPTDLIELLEIKQTVRIEVIAEDGVTRKVYKIEFTNQNLIEKTNNADLRRLAVNYGLMTPNFQSAVTDYEVTTKENAWSVDIVPRVADQYATMRVLNGTRELGDYNGNYALALVDGENNVTIEVTSPDKTVKKNYDITIYRNEEEKLKNLEPLEAEDINFEQVSNPIIVKIEEYPRVGASVFNTIREEYPDRSIIFQGNDYSIRFDGKNLTRVIPQTEIYDFRMTFESPDEEAIYDLIGSRAANDDIIDDAVLCYFDYHGSLPGPATFSLSLGRRYANDTLYWHYYNQERDRIDYYGSLQSNTKGTVAVSIDHFSTYIVTPEHRIAGSEDKAGVIDELGMVSNGQDLLGSGGKLNPDTGVEGSP